MSIKERLKKIIGQESDPYTQIEKAAQNSSALSAKAKNKIAQVCFEYNLNPSELETLQNLSEDDKRYISWKVAELQGVSEQQSAIERLIESDLNMTVEFNPFENRTSLNDEDKDKFTQEIILILNELLPALENRNEEQAEPLKAQLSEQIADLLAGHWNTEPLDSMGEVSRYDRLYLATTYNGDTENTRLNDQEFKLYFTVRKADEEAMVAFAIVGAVKNHQLSFRLQHRDQINQDKGSYSPRNAYHQRVPEVQS